MSKLEDKLTASLKPVQGKTIPRKVASQALAKAKAKPTAAMPSPTAPKGCGAPVRSE